MSKSYTYDQFFAKIQHTVQRLDLNPEASIEVSNDSSPELVEIFVEMPLTKEAEIANIAHQITSELAKQNIEAEILQVFTFEQDFKQYLNYEKSTIWCTIFCKFN